mmetsp:Transcript_3216/g.7089  ORF Transcript_3216/g.7089 Transcript_3216/m.7089 type:complete len:202 (-) Transcript_3216:229-834(-)
MEGRGGRDLRGRGLISLRMLLLGEGWPNAILSRIGRWKIPLIILPSMKFLTILFMPRDTLPLVTPKTPSLSQKMDPLASSTLNSRETKPHGSTTPPSVRDVSSDLPTKTVPPRPSAGSTLPELSVPLTVTFGNLVLLRTLSLMMRHWRLLRVGRRLLLPFTLLGASSAREWRRSLPSMPRVLEFLCINSVEMRSVTLSVPI